MFQVIPPSLFTNSTCCIGQIEWKFMHRKIARKGERRGVVYHSFYFLLSPAYSAHFAQIEQSSQKRQYSIPFINAHSAVPFPKDFRQTCKKILTRLFRVFVHIYIHHFDRLVELGAVRSFFSFFPIRVARNRNFARGTVFYAVRQCFRSLTQTPCTSTSTSSLLNTTWSRPKSSRLW